MVVSIPLYGCTTWMQTKRIEKKQVENCTRCYINKSWIQNPKLKAAVRPVISKIIQIRLTRHAGYSW